MTYTLDKMNIAIKKLKENVEYLYNTDNGFGASSEIEFNNILWVTGEDSGGSAITTNTCPYSEITWTKLKTEMDKL